MSNYDKSLEKEIPEIKESSTGKESELDVSASMSIIQTQGGRWKLVSGIVIVAIVVMGGWELLVRLFNIPEYVFPPPSKIVVALVTSLPNIYPHFFVTLGELVSGFIIGASIGLVSAAILTQFPYIEKIIVPYIILAVMTPTIALVPLLMLRLGFGIMPRIIAVSLAVGPMVMINTVTGFRRTDLAKIALARSYGATTLQIFMKIRFPFALPMITVGLLIGGIFGLITAVGSDLVGGKMGLGNKIAYYAAMARMPNFFATIFLVSLIGVAIWIIITKMGQKWTNWKT